MSDTCNICFESSGKKIDCCNFYWCDNCAAQWLNTKQDDATCPHCRTLIDKDNSESEKYVPTQTQYWTNQHWGEEPRILPPVQVNVHPPEPAPAPLNISQNQQVRISANNMERADFQIHPVRRIRHARRVTLR